MIGEILSQKNLITAESNEKFIHCDAQKFNDIVITAAIMKKDFLYLICESNCLPQPIVCNVDRDFKKSKFVFISPLLNKIIWINQESKYIIISITQLLHYICPQEIIGMPNESPFTLSSLQCSKPSFINDNELHPDVKGQLPFQVLSASWWEPKPQNTFVAFAEKNGIHFLHVFHSESNLKSFPHNDIHHAIFNHSSGKLTATIFTFSSCYLYTFSLQNGSIASSTQQLPLHINSSLPFHIQQNPTNSIISRNNNYISKSDTQQNSTNSVISRSNSYHPKSDTQQNRPTSPITRSISFSSNSKSKSNDKWLYFTLQNELSFYDSNFNELEVSEYQSNSKKTSSIIVTKYFIYYCEKNENNEYKVFARFIHPDHDPIVILQQKANIHLISFDDDEVFLDTETSIIHVSLKKDMIDSIFARLVFNKHLDDAIFIGQGLQLSISYLFRDIIYEYVKQKNYAGAFEIMQHEKCDLRDTLLRFLENGLDRFALHVALRNKDKEKNIEKTIPLFADRIILKYASFYSFASLMKQMFGKTNYLMPPEQFEKSPLFDLYKAKDEKVLSSIPLALQFRYNIFFGIENDDIKILKSASKIDLPVDPIFSFSATYKSLLNQYRAMIDTEEVLITDYVDQICTNLSFFEDSVIFLSDKLYIGNQPIEPPFEIKSFALKGKTLYVIDQILNVYKTELPRIDFIELREIHPCVKIEANDDTVVFLSVSGSLFFEDGDYVTGEFVDIALGKDFVFAVDDRSDFYSISIKGKEKNNENVDTCIYNNMNNTNNKTIHEVRKKNLNNFVHAVSAAGNIPILIISKNSFIVNDQVYKIASFECSNSGKDECFIGGGGQIIVINSKGEVKEPIKYSQRIGSLISIKRSNIDNLILLMGSASSPMKHLDKPLPSEDEPSFAELRFIASSSSNRYSEEFLLDVFTKDPYRTFIFTIFNKWDQVYVPNCTPYGIKSLEPYISDFSEEGASRIFHSLLLLNHTNNTNNDKTNQNENENDDTASYQVSDEMIKTKYARKAFLDFPDDLKTLSRKQLFSILPEPSTIRDIKYVSSHSQLSSLDKSDSRGSFSISYDDEDTGFTEKDSSRRIKLYDKNIIRMDNFSEKLLQWSVHPTIVPSLRFKEGKLFVFNCNHILNSEEMLQNVNKVKKILSSKKLPNTEKLVFNVYLLPKIPAQCPKCLLQRLEAYFK